MRLETIMLALTCACFAIPGWAIDDPSDSATLTNEAGRVTELKVMAFNIWRGGRKDGDYNSPSHLDWIPENRARHNDLVVPWPVSMAMADAGLTDAYREVHPNPLTHPGHTSSPRFSSERNDRIDYVYYKGRNLKATDAEMIDQHPVKWPSDHGAVTTTFSWVGP